MKIRIRNGNEQHFSVYQGNHSPEFSVAEKVIIAKELHDEGSLNISLVRQ